MISFFILKMYIKIPWIAQNTQNQYLVSILVSLLAVIHGCAIGWTSPVIPYLKSDDTHLNAGPITPQQASWIGKVNLLYFKKI